MPTFKGTRELYMILKIRSLSPLEVQISKSEVQLEDSILPCINHTVLKKDAFILAKFKNKSTSKKKQGPCRCVFTALRI